MQMKLGITLLKSGHIISMKFPEPVDHHHHTLQYILYTYTYVYEIFVAANLSVGFFLLPYS